MRLFGIPIKIHGVEHKVYIEKLHKSDYQVAVASWLADFSDAVSFLEVFREGESSVNHTHWCDTIYTQLLEKSYVTADPVDRHALLASCEKILLDAMPIIPLFHYNMQFVQNENVEGIFISRMGGIDFRWARFVQDQDRAHIAQLENAQQVETK
jgi:oligopeptide transport system substrate-binding protein